MKFAVSNFNLAHTQPTKQSDWRLCKNIFCVQTPTRYKMETRSSASKTRIASRQFYCAICMEDCSLEMKVSTKSCGHSFCVNCLKAYVSSSIDSHLADVKCPEVKCNANITHNEIGTLVSKTRLKKLKISKLKLDPSYRECDSCGKQMKFNEQTEMKCKCGTISCFMHGNLHPNETCTSFEYRTTQVTKNLTTIQNTTKKCPNCETDTEKNGGCDHMVSY